jgi:Acyl-CoA dehydrogenase, middle domain
MLWRLPMLLTFKVRSTLACCELGSIRCMRGKSVACLVHQVHACVCPALHDVHRRPGEVVLPTSAGPWACSSSAFPAGSVARDGQDYLVNGQKCWISGACDSHCRVAIFMGKSNPDAAKHRQQCMILVPMDAPGVDVRRPMTVFGDEDAPHGHAEVHFRNVRYVDTK